VLNIKMNFIAPPTDEIPEYLLAENQEVKSFSFVLNQSFYDLNSNNFLNLFYLFDYTLLYSHFTSL